MLRPRFLLALIAVGCGETKLAVDGAVPGGGAEGGVPDLAALEPDAAAPDGDRPADVAADLGADVAPDAEPPWIAPPSCAGLKVNGAPLAVFDATGLTSAYVPGRPSCEGDAPYTVQVNRVLCGSIPANPTLVASTIGPDINQPLMAGERALLAVYAYPCPVYTTPVYAVSDRREPGAWGTLAAMLGADGGP